MNSTVRVLAPHHLLISESLPSSKDIAQLIAGLPLSLLRGAQVNMGEPYSWQLLDLIANCWRLIVAQSWTSNADSVSYFSCRSVFIVVLCPPFSIQNLNKDASTDPSFTTYTEPTATSFGHTVDSDTYSEGEPSTCDYAVPGQAGDPAKEGADLFGPLILEDDSQEEPVLPQVVMTGFIRN